MSKIIIGFYVILTSAGLILMKLGSKHGPPFSISGGKFNTNLNPAIVTGLIFYGISFFTYIYLISKFDLGYIVPLLAAFVYIIVFSASFLIFQETFTIVKILGICFIVTGLVLLNIKAST